MKLVNALFPLLMILSAFVLGFIAWLNDASFVAYIPCLLLLLGGMDWGKE